MTATQPAPDAAPENVNQTGAPNQYHLHAHGTQISYYPDGAGPPTADGPIILAYQDTDYSATFRGSQAHVVAVEGVGTWVTVTPQITADVGSRGHPQRDHYRHVADRPGQPRPATAVAGRQISRRNSV